MKCFARFFCVKLINLPFAFTSAVAAVAVLQPSEDQKWGDFLLIIPKEKQINTEAFTSKMKASPTKKKRMFTNILEEFCPSEYSGKCFSLSIGNTIKEDCSGSDLHNVLPRNGMGRKSHLYRDMHHAWI